MLRDLNFCPSEPPELLELHQFSISPTLRASFSFPLQKSTPLKRKRWNQKITVNWISEHHLPNFLFCGFHVSAKGELGPRWFGILESPSTDSGIPNPWVVPRFESQNHLLPQTNKINQIGWFPTHQNPSNSQGFRMIQGFKVNTTSRSMGSRQSCVRPKPPVVWAPWICSGAQTRSVGWMDGGRLAGFRGGFSPRRMKT